MTVQSKKKSVVKYSLLLFVFGIWGILSFHIISSPAPTISTSWKNAKSVTLRQATFVKNDDSQYDFDTYVVTGQDSHSETIKYYTLTKPTINKGTLKGKVVVLNGALALSHYSEMVYFEESSHHYEKHVQLINHNIEEDDVSAKMGLSLILVASFAFYFLSESFNLNKTT